jgi:hypothetical protein
MQNELVYLAAPYSHQYPIVTEHRVQQLLKADAAIIRKGFVTVTPLSKHFILNVGEKIPGDWEYWKNYSLTLLKRCDRLFILTLDGWEQSTGVQGEIEEAKKNNIPIYLVDIEGNLETYLWID